VEEISGLSRGVVDIFTFWVLELHVLVQHISITFNDPDSAGASGGSRTATAEALSIRNQPLLPNNPVK
jgi:hypothetical protein